MSDEVKALALFLKLSEAADASDFISILGDILDTSPQDIALLTADQVGVIQALFGADASVLRFLTERGLIGDYSEEDGEAGADDVNEEEEGDGGPAGAGSALFTQLMNVGSASELVEQILAAGAEAVGSQLSAQEIDAIILPYLGDAFFLGFLESNGVSSIDLQGPEARAIATGLVAADATLSFDESGRVLNAAQELMIFTPAGQFVQAPAESLRVLGAIAEDTDVVLPADEVDNELEGVTIIDSPEEELGPDDPQPDETPLELGLDDSSFIAPEEGEPVPTDSPIPTDPGSDIFMPDQPIGDGDSGAMSDTSSLILVGVPPSV